MLQFIGVLVSRQSRERLCEDRGDCIFYYFLLFYGLFLQHMICILGTVLFEIMHQKRTM